LRLGYVIASEEVITALEGGRMPWSVNALALEAGCFLLSQPVDFKKIRARLHPEVKRIQQAFESTGQIETYPSDTHYFLSRLRTGNASSLKEFLARKHGLLIRNAENFAPHYKGYFRIAVQTPKENDLLIEAIKQYDFSL
ncbi:MAG: aminotransferase class I/II-fold pyridoxal phosphate-dependent enzyme, partial [Bacteroidales bacterium]